MTRFLTSLLVIAFLATAAPAAVVFEWVPAIEPGPVGDGYIPEGYVCYDLMMTVETNVAQIQIYIEADDPAPEDMYQDAMGTNQKPSDAWIGMVPSLEFDTYWALPVSGGEIGAAINIVPVPGDRTQTFSDQLLDVAWAVSGGANSDPGTYQVARVTSKASKAGTWRVWGQETHQLPIPEYTAEGITPLWLPEPATLLVLLGGALLGMLRRR